MAKITVKEAMDEARKKISDLRTKMEKTVEEAFPKHDDSYEMSVPSEEKVEYPKHDESYEMSVPQEEKSLAVKEDKKAELSALADKFKEVVGQMQTKVSEMKEKHEARSAEQPSDNIKHDENYENTIQLDDDTIFVQHDERFQKSTPAEEYSSDNKKNNSKFSEKLKEVYGNIKTKVSELKEMGEEVQFRIAEKRARARMEKAEIKARKDRIAKNEARIKELEEEIAQIVDSVDAYKKEREEQQQQEQVAKPAKKPEMTEEDVRKAFPFLQKLEAKLAEQETKTATQVASQSATQVADQASTQVSTQPSAQVATQTSAQVTGQVSTQVATQVQANKVITNEVLTTLMPIEYYILRYRDLDVRFRVSTVTLFTFAEYVIDHYLVVGAQRDTLVNVMKSRTENLGLSLIQKTILERRSYEILSQIQVTKAVGLESYVTKEAPLTV